MTEGLETKGPISLRLFTISSRADVRTVIFLQWGCKVKRWMQRPLSPKVASASYYFWEVGVYHMFEVHKGAKPFDFSGREAAVLLIHGFTGSPYEMRPLGEYLASKGFRVKGIRLSGHGTCPEDMLFCTAEDWLESCRAAVRELAADQLPVVVIGHSMGGALSLLLASEAEVAAVVTMCAPVYLNSWLQHLVPIARLFKRYHRVLDLKKISPALRDARPVYDRVPVCSAVELLKLVRGAKAVLPRIEIPALVIQSELDDVVPPGNGRFIHERLGSRQKQLLTLHKSGHVVTMGADKDAIYQTVNQFVSGLAAQIPAASASN